MPLEQHEQPQKKNLATGARATRISRLPFKHSPRAAPERGQAMNIKRSSKDENKNEGEKLHDAFDVMESAG